MAKIIIKFDQHGNINADAVGFTGTACEQATATILAGIGKAVADDKKPEYYNTDGVSAGSEQAKVAGRW